MTLIQLKQSLLHNNARRDGGAYDSADDNDGTIYGATWTTGKVDDALSFDGVDDYVSVSDDPSLRISEKLTIEAWVNIADRSYFREVVVKQGNYHFRIHDGYLRFNFWNGKWWGAEDDTTRLDTDNWYHIAFSFDTVNDIMKFYVNGNNVKNVTHGWDMLTWDDPVTIGSASPGAAYRDWFNGVIDEVAIHNRILTPEEIQQHYENGLMGLGYREVDWWPMFRHDLMHTGYSTSTAPNTNNTIWNYTADYDVDSSPAVADGRVYVGSRDGKVYCLNASTGAFIWSYQTGDWVESSPAVADGNVYVGSWDYNVYCLPMNDPNSDGVIDNSEVIWTYTTGGYVTKSSPAVADGKVYVGTTTYPGGSDNKVYCLNASTGAFIWSYQTGGPVESSPAVADGKVYVGSRDGKVYCLPQDDPNDDGVIDSSEVIWSYTTWGDVSSSPAVADGRVYIGSENWVRALYCLDAANGSIIWSYTMDHWVRLSSPAVADGRVYVGSWDDKVYCLDASTGAHIWNYTTGNHVTSSPAVADGKVYVGSWDFKVYCLDVVGNGDGTTDLIWSYTTGGGVWNSPAVADGKVYVGSNDNRVYAFGPTYPLTITTTSGGTTNPSPGTHTYSKGASASVTAFPDTYYLFDHWELDGVNVGSANPISVLMDDNHTLHAVFAIHDIAVTNVTSHKTVVGQGYCMNITVTVENQGNYTETFDVTTYHNSNVINYTTVTNLPPGEETTLTFTWNTTGVAKTTTTHLANYTITAKATPIPGETDTADNTLTDGWVIVAMVGDLTGPDGWPDGKCDIRDIALVAKYFGQNVPPAPPNCDITGPTTGVADGKIDIRDIAAVAIHFGEIDP